MNQSLSMSGNLSKPREATLSGVGLFIFIELLLFAGFFLLYGVYRYKNVIAFDLAAGELSITSGFVNTLIILAGSLTMAFSGVAIRKGNKMTTLFWLLTTLFMGFMFIVNRYFEWKGRVDFGLFPGSEELTRLGHGDVMFYGLYFFMTGLHLIHLLIGFATLIYVTTKVNNNDLHKNDYAVLDKTGSYWHLATLIWLLVFPLFYLM
ncbi:MULTISPECIES: cytochrome c oxidase subunit 3 [unclassified Carboxylicivirga]|uniref:cytochrome c oxidase subunit 3 n=1 Tax=Carboxylicivirga TaxID=1628153 RepID=UPI003D333D20